MEIAIYLGIYLLGIPITAAILNSVWSEGLDSSDVGWMSVSWPAGLAFILVVIPLYLVAVSLDRVMRFIGKIARPRGR
jgi:hypothetical protein